MKEMTSAKISQAFTTHEVGNVLFRFFFEFCDPEVVDNFKIRACWPSAKSHLRKLRLFPKK